MTDNDIIKALECCSTNNQKCYDCPLHTDCMMGVPSKNISRAALELVQRQQERIERLKDNLDAVLKERAGLDVDRVVEKLKEKSYGFEGLEYIDIDTAIAIMQGVRTDDR